MNRIAVQVPKQPLQALDAERVELIGAAVARAVKALDGACMPGQMRKPPDNAEGLELFAVLIGRGGFIAGCISHYVRGFTMQGVA